MGGRGGRYSLGHNSVSVLLGHHHEGIGLTVGGGVGAQIMHVNTVHYLGLRPVVVDQHLDPVSHVVGHDGVLQHHVAPGGVHVQPVASVAGDVGVGDGYQVGRVGDVQT